MAEPNQNVREWYENRLREYYTERYRGLLMYEETPDWHSELSQSATFYPREDHGQLPEQVRAAFDFYWQEFEQKDLGSVRVYRVPAGEQATFALRVSTDGDDGFLEVYDEGGNFLAAGRTYLDLAAWGSQDWLREQAPHPWVLPPELSDAPQRTLWGKPVEGFCNVPCTGACHTPSGHCIRRAGHVENEGNWHRCSRCGHRWGDGTDPEASPPVQAVPAVEPIWFAAHFMDGRTLEVALKQDPISFGTNFGYLNVTAWAMRQLEFATRLSTSDHYFIGTALAKLASDSAEERAAAEADLLKFGGRVYRVLTCFAQVATGELQRRAEEQATRLRDRLPPDLLAFRKSDVVETRDSKFTGKFEGGLLEVTTRAGESQSIPIAELHCLRKLPSGETEALSDPFSLDMEYGNLYGTKAAFQVTGVPYGYVCGTDVYSLNSQLATAAVHAGVLQTGQTGVVRVEVILPPTSFTGSERNGIVSNDLQDYPAGAFRFLAE